MSRSGNSRQRKTRLVLLKKLVELESGPNRSHLMGKFKNGFDDVDSIILVLGSSSSVHSSQEFDEQVKNESRIIETNSEKHQDVDLKKASEDQNNYVFLDRVGQR